LDNCDKERERVEKSEILHLAFAKVLADKVGLVELPEIFALASLAVYLPL
jgi:hypothetical protein